MKTGEWIIKLLSYIVCLFAVCAGFAYKEKQADAALSAYMKREEGQRTERLCDLLLRLKEGMKNSIADGEEASAAEISYCCKAATDLIAECEPDKKSEPLRAYLIRIKNACDLLQDENKKADANTWQIMSALYTRLSALEEVLRDRSISADSLIAELSHGLPENNGNTAEKARISKSRAERYAKSDMTGIRLTKCEKYNGKFVFSSSGSFTVLDGEGNTAVKSRTVTEGREKFGATEAAERAKDYITDITELPSEAEFICDAFGILYFRVICDGKEYPVGIDKTDGKVVFTVICR